MLQCCGIKMQNSSFFKRLDKNAEASVFLLIAPAIGRTFFSYVRSARLLPGHIGCICIAESIYDLTSLSLIESTFNEQLDDFRSNPQFFVIGHCGGNSLAQFICSSSSVKDQILGLIMVDVYPKESESLKVKKDIKTNQSLLTNTASLNQSDAELASFRFFNAVNLAPSLEKPVNHIPTYIISDLNNYDFPEIQKTHSDIRSIVYTEHSLEVIKPEVVDMILKIIQNHQF